MELCVTVMYEYINTKNTSGYGWYYTFPWIFWAVTWRRPSYPRCAVQSLILRHTNPMVSPCQWKQCV